MENRRSNVRNSTMSPIMSMASLYRRRIKEDSRSRIEYGRSADIHRIVLFFGIIILATGVWSCVQSRVPFRLAGAAASFAPPGKVLLFGGAALTTASGITILQSQHQPRIVLLALNRVLAKVIILETVAGAMAYAQDTVVLVGSLNSSLLQDLSTDYSRVPRVTHMWDRLQRDFRCCGVHGPDDWLRSSWMNRNRSDGPPVPQSCFRRVGRNGSEDIFSQGCSSSATRALHQCLLRTQECAFSLVPLHVTLFLMLSRVNRHL